MGILLTLFAVGAVVLLASKRGYACTGSTISYPQGGNPCGPTPACNPCTDPCADGSGVNCPGGSCLGSIDANPGTWPTGDRIWDICRAIAYAEGANISGSVPDRTNNPGDISDGGSEYGHTAADGSNVTDFPDKATGWQWLYNKVSAIINGKSSVYDANWTIAQVSQKWAGNSGAWANNVASRLGVSTDSTWTDYVYGCNGGCCARITPGCCCCSCCSCC